MKSLLFTLLLGALLMQPHTTQAQQNTVTLQAVRDRQRVLLVFANGDNQAAEAQLNVAATHADGFRERDLLLVGLVGTNANLHSGLLSATDDAAARKRFGVRPGEFTVILIGKDGGEKLRSHKPIGWEKLQSTIDAMPMRKDEMQNRQ